MKFTDFKVRNFLSIGEADLSLDGLGLVMVAGENLDETSADSNGSGKSSLADALSWCLWGKTARGVTGDDVINTAAGKGCMVSVVCDDDGELYRVERYRKGGKMKNGLFLYHLLSTGEWADITKGTNALTQKQVERLLGCSEDVFNAAVYSGQEQTPDIPNMSDKMLKTLVEQAAGVDVLTNAYDIARERARETATKRAATQIDYDRALERHATATSSIALTSDRANQWEADQKTKLDQLKQRTVDAKTEYELGKDELDPDGEQKLRDEIAEIEVKIAAVNTERQREQVLAGDVATAQQTLQILDRNIATAEQTVKQANGAVERTAQQLEDVKNGVGKPCKTCTRPLEAEHLEQAIANAQQYHDNDKKAQQDAITQLASLQARVPAAQKLLTGAEEGLEKHRTGMTDVTAEAQRLGNLRRELQIAEGAKTEVERMRVTAVNAATVWKSATAETNPFTPMIESMNDELLKLGEACETKKQEAIDAQKEEAYAQAVVEVFSPSGVRAHRLDEATPYLNERTAHYLGSLADGAIEAFWTTLTLTKGNELREKFSVTVEKAGSAPSFANLSGGEKRKVRLACALALQDLVATRAAKNIELWVGDEIDDALDAAGLERLMGVLEEKARERGSVLVISHNDIRDFARKTFTVTKQGGRATVSIA